MLHTCIKCTQNQMHVRACYKRSALTHRIKCMCVLAFPARYNLRSLNSYQYCRTAITFKLKKLKLTTDNAVMKITRSFKLITNKTVMRHAPNNYISEHAKSWGWDEIRTTVGSKCLRYI